MPRAPRSLPLEHTRCVVCSADAPRAIGAGVDFEYDTCDNVFTFSACDACGHVYLADRPRPDQLGQIYPPDYGNYDAERGRALTFKVKAWLDRRALTELGTLHGQPRAILDVGCADGRLLDQCARVFPDATELAGVEISDAAAEAAIAKGYAVTVGSVDSLELPGGRYDLVFLQQVIEHVFEPARVLSTLTHTLRPGGLLILDTPTVDCIDFKLFKKRYWGGYHIPRHLNLFSERSLLRLATDAGLVHVRTRYTPQPIHWIWSVHHFLQDHGAPAWSTRPLNIQNPFAIGAFTLVELAARGLIGHMSNMQLVLKQPVGRAERSHAPHASRATEAPR